MKKIYIFLSIIAISSNYLQAQKAEIGFTMSLFSDNSIARFGSSYLDDADYNAGRSVTYGLTYLKLLNNWLVMETGIEFLKCEASVHSIIPGYSENFRYGSVSLLNIPIGVRLNFLKYCFVNGGILFDVDVSQDSPIDRQIGLGSQLGAGLKYDFKTGISLFINPYYKIHALIPATFNNSNQHLLESAVRFGVTYHL
jgi:hypothetical protein